jgi:NADP-dependent 3-hydroxy acid dehydrogenase YdfG
MLSGQVAVITGASSGIGAATASLLAAAGAKVVMGARREDRLHALKDEIAARSGEALAVRCDVTVRDDCEALLQTGIDRWGRVDVLINNAGIMPLSFVKSLQVDEWERMIDVNIKGVLFCTAAALPHLLAQESGHIVNISSIAGKRVIPSGSVYCATKFAVNAFSDALRLELSARKNIRVTCIQPGIVATELADAITDPHLASFQKHIKGIEALQAEDIANAILYAVQAPAHVNVNEIVLRPTQQER